MGRVVDSVVFFNIFLFLRVANQNPQKTLPFFLILSSNIQKNARTIFIK